MRDVILGKVMVMSIIVAGLIQIFQKLFIGDSAVLTNIKMFFLVLALLSALVVVSIMSWKASKREKNKLE